MIEQTAAKHINGFALPSSASSPLRVLILDDSGFDRLRIRRLIGVTGLNAKMDEISCLCRLESMLDSKPYDLCIFDYFLPDGTAHEALELLNKSEQNAIADVIVVSAIAYVSEKLEKLDQSRVKFVTKSSASYEEALRELGYFS